MCIYVNSALIDGAILFPNVIAPGICCLYLSIKCRESQFYMFYFADTLRYLSLVFRSIWRRYSYILIFVSRDKMKAKTAGY